MNHFDYMTSITSSKIDIMCDDIDEKAYNSFMVNRGLSYFYDTVLFANEMNKYSHLDSRLQYDFLRQIVRKKKRFSKWLKPPRRFQAAIERRSWSASPGVNPAATIAICMTCS